MSKYAEEIRALVTGMDRTNQEQEPHNQPEDIQDVYVLIVREQEEPPDNRYVVDSAPANVPVSVQHDSFLSAYLFVCFSLLLLLTTFTCQLYCTFNPLTATVTILPKSEQLTLSGTMQMGRVLPALTISQTQTTPTTGHGHQDARAATGYLTFYNGQLTSIFIPVGTLLTGNDGVQILTDQDATIPAANLPQIGQATVSAHAIQTGASGNMPAYDINQGCCATAIKAVNTQAFYGGQDERTYTTVTQHDIHSISTVLKTSIGQSITGALQGQLKPNEQLQLLPCTPTVTSDHQPGAEATTVKVTVSQTCSAIAYNSQELETKATAYVQTQAQRKAGAGYSLFGTAQVHVTQARVNTTTLHPVFLSFQATGTWVYGISSTAQQQIKHLIADKTTELAAQLLSHLPGMKSATIRFSGFGDESRIPKQASDIHLSIIVV